MPGSEVSNVKERSRKWLAKKSRISFRGYPVGTIAFYGPDDRRASKMVASVVADDAEAGPVELRRWVSDVGDVRSDPEALAEAASFLRLHAVRSIGMIDSIIGCPHEEGIDYPPAEDCPYCPFWAGRDRWAPR